MDVVDVALYVVNLVLDVDVRAQRCVSVCSSLWWKMVEFVNDVEGEILVNGTRVVDVDEKPGFKGNEDDPCCAPLDFSEGCWKRRRCC